MQDCLGKTLIFLVLYCCNSFLFKQLYVFSADLRYSIDTGKVQNFKAHKSNEGIVGVPMLKT
jgi:hypothetical protein